MLYTLNEGRRLTLSAEYDHEKADETERRLRELGTTRMARRSTHSRLLRSAHKLVVV